MDNNVIEEPKAKGRPIDRVLNFMSPKTNKEFYSNYGLPLMAIIETLGSSGRSPGTATMAGTKLASDQMAAESDREDSALARKLRELEYGKAEKAQSQEAALEAAIKRRLGEGDLKGADYETLYREHFPSEYAKQQADLEMMMGRFLGQANITDQFNRGREGRTKETEEERNARELAEKLEAEKRAQGTKIEEENRAEARRLEAEARKVKQAAADRQAKYDEKMKPVRSKVAELVALGDEIPASGRVSGVLESVKAPIGFNPKLKVYDAAFMSMLGQFARAGGEVGALSEGDQQRAAGLKFSPMDTPAERALKKKFITAIIGASPDEVQTILGEAESTLAKQATGTAEVDSPWSDAEEKRLQELEAKEKAGTLK